MREDGILTALPGTSRDGRLRVTAFVTPRLDTGGDRLPLREFAQVRDNPDGRTGFEDWGSVAEILHTTLMLEVDGVGALTLAPDPDSPSPDPHLWRTLFDGVHVGPGDFQDLSDHRIASFPSVGVRELVRDTYTAVAEQSPTTHPPATGGPLSILHPIGELVLYGRERGEGWERPTGALRGTSPSPRDPNGPGRIVDRVHTSRGTPERVRQTINEVLRFYDRPGAADPEGPDVVPGQPGRPDPDFHALCATLGDYPDLLRLLGLALDLAIVEGEHLAEGTGRLRFVDVGEPEWLQHESARPWTAFELQAGRFVAEPRNREDELVDGSLRVEDGRLFHVEQIDLDGAALKLAGTARTVVTTAQTVNAKPGDDTVAASMTPDAVTLPALRGTGLTLYRDQRAGAVVHAWDDTARREADRVHGDVTLFAEEVTRGYRLDVAEESDPDAWFSLHERIGTYWLRDDASGARAPLPIVPPERRDEGYLKRASASHNAAEVGVAYLHEAVAGWEGWSLAAPRPGHRIGATAVEPVSREQRGTDLPLEVETRVAPGTLPRLRFGGSYRLRARLVDMAGNSVEPALLEPSHVTDATTFRRWDPVPSPAVVPRRPFTEGESLLRLVIRSTLGVSASDYVRLPRVVDLAGHRRDDLAYRAAAERHLAAPIGAQQLAELHGCFDEAVRRGSTPAQRDAAFEVARRSEGTFASPADAGAITDGVDPPRPFPTLDAAGNPLPVHHNVLGAGEYVVHDVARLSLPYLPDPLAVGLSFTTLPGDGDTRVLDWPGGPDWYDRRPVLLRVEEGTGAPVWDADARCLTVLLPQAAHVRVRVSSVIPRGDLPLLGVWMLEREAVRAAQEEDAVLGRHWMLTPWTVLDLVHAVEKPLQPPVVQVAEPAVYNSGVHRFQGETFAALNGTIACHAASTGRLDVDATWTEWHDDLHEAGPRQVPGQAHVGDFLVDPGEDQARVGRTAYASRPGVGATHLLRHEFGDTRHRRIAYRATASTRFREYFPPEITDRVLGGDLIEHRGPELLLHVPSSHRPDPPDVASVVPTWSWEEHETAGVQTTSTSERLPGGLRRTRVRRRIGGGLRVYLNRPWYSSGDDELLGVVVRDQPWLTLPIDRDAGFQVPPTALAAADLAVGELVRAGLVGDLARVGQRSAPRHPTDDLLATLRRHASVETVRPPGRATPEEAQWNSHLAVLAGAGLGREVAEAAAVTESLSGLLGSLLGQQGSDEHLTRWGTDPVWRSRPVAPGPFIHHLPLRTAVGTGIAVPGVPGRAVVVGHQPVYEPSRKLWYCDLQLHAGAAYQPFVDLALVRYQPYAIDGAHASAVVRPGHVQLLPDRTAALTPLADGSFAVSVRGPAGYNALAEGYLFGQPDAVIADAAREVMAQVQTRPAGAGDLDWKRAGPEVRLRAGSGSLADLSWHGTLPAMVAREGVDTRVLLTEHELFETDPSQAETYVYRPVGGVGESARKPAGRRLVFATDFAM
ncbi:hypothetical protein [Egicoccus sp. AB-alg6-2]|uniref:hypothetical protein n=1 Tax=Egicoccus sp. AB-alg6-2 TaxID=3242692 RepID=UPI00359D4738